MVGHLESHTHTSGQIGASDPDTVLVAGNAYLEQLYEAYLHDPVSVSPPWQQFFASMGTAAASHPETRHQEWVAYFTQYFRHPLGGRTAPSAASPSVSAGTTPAALSRIGEWVSAYRCYGHTQAQLDPLGLQPRFANPALGLHGYGLEGLDPETPVDSGYFLGSSAPNTFAALAAALQQTYCRTVGAEYMHITDPAEKAWLQERIEHTRMQPVFEPSAQRAILAQLTAAEGLEKYLHTQFVGQKRFSLEGGDALIPCLWALVEQAGQAGVQEVVFAMAHRGRLNMLINVMGKPPADLFAEFAGKGTSDGDWESAPSGDVKYHMGYSSDVITAQGAPIHQVLAFNPSHLEIVTPVAEGSAKARQDRRLDTTGKYVLPVSIHGDAAFAGQGVVMETGNMSQTRGYRTGGTIHLVINNQIGFTTHTPQDARSTRYCTDIAKMMESPVFHVNADDVEAAVWVTQLAVDYRARFGKDVVIDLVCYRRHGHNEADEPAATQPLMYQVIREKATPRALYAEQLIAAGVITSEAVEQMLIDYRQQLERGIPVVSQLAPHPVPAAVDWSPYHSQSWEHPTDTGASRAELERCAQALEHAWSPLTLQPQVAKVMRDRLAMMAGKQPLDWGCAETLAYGTLLQAGYPIRLSGQDCGRGTFAHRHAVLADQKTGETVIPLQQLYPGQPPFTVIDSLLSEEAVLAFEYGYAGTAPHTLVLWEAQFGDFANGAQVVIDQFIASGEQKWGRLCGLVMLLPHGYEGMGPEHSSARLERFLQLCAQDNIQVCVPTTPAQIFHLLRRQALRPYRKPLVVMSPKSLLRHRSAVSSREMLETGRFETVLADPHVDPKQVKRVVWCTGKVYYDLHEARVQAQQHDVALMRIEQLYPFPQQAVEAALAPYTASTITDWVWCQEEPLNQGAWMFIRDYLQPAVSGGRMLRYAGRSAAAAPAVGSYAVHTRQQQALVASALGLAG